MKRNFENWISSVIMLLVLFVVLWLFLGLPDLVKDLSANRYNNKFQNMDYAAAKGSKLVTYDEDEDFYSSQYLSKEVTAKKTKEVGGVLRITRTYDKTKYFSVGGGSGRVRKREILHVELIHCATGKVIATQTFEATSPLQTSSSGTDTVSESKVTEWVLKNWKG